MTLDTALKNGLMALARDAIIRDIGQIYGYDTKTDEKSDEKIRQERTKPELLPASASPLRCIDDSLTDLRLISLKRGISGQGVLFVHIVNVFLRERLLAMRHGTKSFVFVFDKGIPRNKLLEALRRIEARRRTQELKLQKKREAEGITVATANIPPGGATLCDEDDVMRMFNELPALETEDGEEIVVPSPSSSRPSSPSVPLSPTLSPLSTTAFAAVQPFVPKPYDRHCMFLKGRILRFRYPVAKKKKTAVPGDAKESVVSDDKEDEEILVPASENRIIEIEEHVVLTWLLNDSRLRSQMLYSMIDYIHLHNQKLMQSEPGRWSDVTFFIDAKTSEERRIFDVVERKWVLTRKGGFVIRAGRLWFDSRLNTDYLEADHAIGTWVGRYLLSPYNNPADPSSLQHMIVHTVDGDLLIVLLWAVFHYRESQGKFKRTDGEFSKIMTRAGGEHENSGFTCAPLPSGYRRATEPHVICALYHYKPQYAKLADVNEMLSLLMNRGLSPAVLSIAAGATKSDYLDKDRITKGIGVKVIWEALMKYLASSNIVVVQFERLQTPWTRKNYRARLSKALGRELSITDEDADAVYDILCEAFVNWRCCSMVFVSGNNS